MDGTMPSAPPIVPMRGDADAEDCARIMSQSEPWITLGRDYARSLEVMRLPTQEVHVALDAAGRVSGFIVLIMQGALVGYIRVLAVREDWRSRGVGAALVAFAEQRIHRQSPNVFLCVSSFNPRGRAFYERLGFESVGELRDFIVAGHSEWLMRKTIGPLADFCPAGSTPDGAAAPPFGAPE